MMLWVIHSILVSVIIARYERPRSRKEEYYGDRYSRTDVKDFSDTYKRSQHWSSPLFRGDYQGNSYRRKSDKKTSGTDRKDSHFAQHSNGWVPLFHSKVPLHQSEVPLYNSEVPLYNSEVPHYHGEVPQYHSEVPLYHSKVPPHHNEPGMSEMVTRSWQPVVGDHYKGISEDSMPVFSTGDQSYSDSDEVVVYRQLSDMTGEGGWVPVHTRHDNIRGGQQTPDYDINTIDQNSNNQYTRHTRPMIERYSHHYDEYGYDSPDYYSPNNNYRELPFIEMDRDDIIRDLNMNMQIRHQKGNHKKADVNHLNNQQTFEREDLQIYRQLLREGQRKDIVDQVKNILRLESTMSQPRNNDALIGLMKYIEDADVYDRSFIQNQKKKTQSLESYSDNKRVTSQRKNQQQQLEDKKRNRILLEIKRHKEMIADKQGPNKKYVINDKRRKQFYDKNKAMIRAMIQARRKKKKRKKEEAEISVSLDLEENHDLPDSQTFETLESKLVNKLRMAIKSPASNLKPNEKKGALEWLDFKLNSGILKKTDKAIKEKMERKLNVLDIDNTQKSNVNEYESYDEYGYYETDESDYDIDFS